MKVALLLLIVLVATPISAVKLCNELSIEYTLSTYDGNCLYGTTTVYGYDVTADHQVLTLNSTSGLFEYFNILDLSIGDVVQSVFGTTTITGISATTITSPYLTMGQVFNEETFYSSFNPYAINQFVKLLATEDLTVSSTLISPIAATYVSNNLTIAYSSPQLQTDELQVLLGLFNSSNMQFYGSVSCGGVGRDIYYYEPKLLLNNLALDSLYRSFKVMAFEEYFKMLDYAFAQPNGMFFDGINIIFDYTLSLPSCSALEITTADGYLIVNDYVLED